MAAVKLTVAQQVAQQLRDQARQLILQAEALEATAPRQPKRRIVEVMDPRTGKVLWSNKR
jgi:hypothetical protein